MNAQHSDKHSGFVLLATLWVLVMLGIVVTTLSYQVRVEATIARQALDKSQRRMAARSGAHIAAARLKAIARKKPDNQKPVPSPDKQADWKDIAIGDAKVSIFSNLQDARTPEQTNTQSTLDTNRHEGKKQIYGPRDGESRLNINVARPEQLTGFPGISTVLAESIARYRRELQPEVPNQDALRPDADGSVNEEITLISGPIVSLQQLLDVEGVSESLLFEQKNRQRALAEHLTTASSGKVNINTAAEPVLLAAGLADKQLSKVLSTREDNPFSSLDEVRSAISLDASSEKWQRFEDTFTTLSSTYTLVAAANLPSSKHKNYIKAVLFDDGESMHFVQWQER